MSNYQGRISIYDKGNKLLESKHYYSKKGRMDIMRIWRCEYAHNAVYFNIYPYAMAPDVPNEIKKRFIHVPIKPVDFKRPKAEYGNIQVYNYGK